MFLFLVFFAIKTLVALLHTEDAQKLPVALKHEQVTNAFSLKNRLNPFKWTFKATYPDFYEELHKHD